MNYDKDFERNYVFENNNCMTLEELIKFKEMKEPVYVLFKRKNKNGEFTVLEEKVIIRSIFDKPSFDDAVKDKVISVYMISDKDSVKFCNVDFLLSQIGELCLFLKNKPGEKYIKISVDNIVEQGEYCKKCKYWSNIKCFYDEYGRQHDASCFLFLSCLDYDYNVGELIKCEQCRNITG